MKNMKLLAMLMALVCALCLGGLVACGGGGGEGDGTAADNAAQEAPAPTDEELIKADAENVLGTVISADALLSGLKDDEQMKEFESMGVDLKAYAENMAKIFKFEVVSVDVDGDAAVAHTKLTAPDFTSDAITTLMEKKFADLTDGKDTEDMTQEELMPFFADAMNAILSDPDFPTSTEEFDIDYVKESGTWHMKDQASIENMLGNAANTAK